MDNRLVFECAGRSLAGWHICGVNAEQCVSQEADYLKLLDNSSFRECALERNIGSIPAEYTLQIEMRLAQPINLVIDPSKWGCEVVWCQQIIYIGNIAGNSFSANFSKDGIWIFYNPSDRPAGPGGRLVKIPDTARFIDRDWHTWTFQVCGQDSSDDDFCDIYRDGRPIAMRIMAHNHEFRDGTICICNRGIEPNPAEMHIRSIKLWAGREVN